MLIILDNFKSHHADGSAGKALELRMDLTFLPTLNCSIRDE